MKIGLVAEPWWVNLAVLVPVVAFFFWRRNPIAITARQLILVGLFAASFGFLEAMVVIYLRAALGLQPGYPEALPDVFRLTSQLQALGEIPRRLLTLEVFREAATIAMLISLALLTFGRAKDRVAVFLWSFAIWDMVYYASLWATVRWPHSITDKDVLFLIPQPWFAPVWFPLLVCSLTLLAVLLTRASPAKA